jgi:hypothetical protein
MKPPWPLLCRLSVLQAYLFILLNLSTAGQAVEKAIHAWLDWYIQCEARVSDTP